MKKIVLGLLVCLFVQGSVHAAEKIRIGFPEFNSSTFTSAVGADQRVFQ